MHGCDSRWIESVPVTATRDGEVVWDGQVQIFALVGHPKATRCFAWSHTTMEGEWFYAVLELGSVTDAAAAVHTVIANDTRRGAP